MTVFLTGSTGFVGRSVAHALMSRYKLITPVRKATKYSNNFQYSPIISDFSDYSDLLNNVDVVVHAAAKAHSIDTPLSEFIAINTKMTLDLARSSALKGVKRFIFLSSIGVNGTSNFKPFTVDDIPAPLEKYAVSKLEAEIGLKKIAAETGLDVVIIRPPLVYGAGAPGNFGKLFKLSQKNLPLPLGAIDNKRSLVALDNLVDLILTCIEHPNAANQIFLVSDGHDLSTTELLQMMVRAAGKTPRLIPMPVPWLGLAAKLIGKEAVIDRLCGSLQVDITHTRQTLGWEPPITVEEGIRRCFVREDLC